MTHLESVERMTERDALVDAIETFIDAKIARALKTTPAQPWHARVVDRAREDMREKLREFRT